LTEIKQLTALGWHISDNAAARDWHKALREAPAQGCYAWTMREKVKTRKNPMAVIQSHDFYDCL